MRSGSRSLGYSVASGAQVKIVAIGMMLAVLFIAASNASGVDKKDCFYKTGDTPGRVSPSSGSTPNSAGSP